MIWVLLLIFIALTIFGVWYFKENYSEYDLTGHEILGAITGFIGAAGVVVCLIGSICLVTEIVKLKVVDDQIAMYQEENTNIEDQIAATVKQYQEYETEIFTEVAPESSITLVALYPELKSDTLVQKQIEVYTANNQKIKELKESKINGRVNRWWLYFGK